MSEEHAQDMLVIGDDAGFEDLPQGEVQRLEGEEALGINIQSLNRALMRDQRSKLVSSMGCISNPGGPGC
jgi:hypothetical protein